MQIGGYEFNTGTEAADARRARAMAAAAQEAAQSRSGSPRQAVERQSGRTRVARGGVYQMPVENREPRVRHMGDPVLPLIDQMHEVQARQEGKLEQLERIAEQQRVAGSAAPRGLREQGRIGLTPPEDTARHGGPQRPKIEDIGGGRIRLRGYHATKSPGPHWNPKVDEALHMGTERASLHRMYGVQYDDAGRIASKTNPHGLYEITVEGPRERFFGVQQGVSDDAANSMAMLNRDPTASRNPSLQTPENQRIARAVADKQAAAVGYRNGWEDPGSRSWIVTDPSAITNIRRIYDAGSTTLGLMGLLGTAAQFIPGFSERMPRTAWLANGGPMGDLLQDVISRNYAPGGIMDPYRDMRNMPGFNPATGSVPA